MPDTYKQQIAAFSAEIDWDFWRNPQGVSIPDDELDFLLVPDAVEAAAVADLAQQVHRYQQDNAGTADAIGCALIVTMGGMLPGVLIYDHLVEGRGANHPRIEFGTVGVSLYKGPGELYDEPQVNHGISVSVTDKTVLLIDDLVDRGGTMAFLNGHVLDSGAHKTLSLVLYMKPAAKARGAADFYFGELPQDTWIITPRELVETLVKRVPVWKQRGANEAECRRRLVEIIGFPTAVVEAYLPRVYLHA